MRDRRKKPLLITLIIISSVLILSSGFGASYLICQKADRIVRFVEVLREESELFVGEIIPKHTPETPEETTAGVQPETEEAAVPITDAENSGAAQIQDTTSSTSSMPGSDLSVPVTITQQEESTANAVVSNIQTASQYSTVKACHDWIVANTVYTTDFRYNTADGVFSYGQSACLGYSLAFKALMDQAGIECYVVYGDDYNTSDAYGHAWNVVKVDGSWYHVDVTWDDPLTGGVNGSGTENLVYDFFLVPDTVITQSHIIECLSDGSSVPGCSSNTYLFSIKDYNAPTVVILSSLSQFSDEYTRCISQGNINATFFYPGNENISDLTIGNNVWRQGISNISIRPCSNKYSNGTYNDYSFFTVYGS